MKMPKICVLYGGVGNERAVSLESGRAVVEALEGVLEIIPYDLRDVSIPNFIRGEEMVVLPVLHGSFGENGKMQAQLESMGIEYCGCDSRASEICIDKISAKRVAASQGVAVVDSVSFPYGSIPQHSDLKGKLGDVYVIKPVDEGSSVGLFMVHGESDYEEACASIRSGNWMAETRITGLEISVGVLGGKAQGIVAIRPEGGVYDYERKYTAGSSNYEYPAKFSDVLTRQIQAQTEAIFEACGCRDYARVDYIVDSAEKPVFLEINSLPGLTPTSLLPKSASCSGLSFIDLLKVMLDPAIGRWNERYGK